MRPTSAWQFCEPHPPMAGEGHRSSINGPLAVRADEAAVQSVQTEVWATLAGGDGQLDGQAAMGSAVTSLGSNGAIS